MSSPPPTSLRPLAHELRNALAPVRNAAHLLRKRAAGDPIVATALRTIDSAVDRSLRLLDSAVDAERVMRGDVELASDDVDVAALVQRTLADASATLAERRQKVHVIADDALAVRGDAQRLAQVVATLVDNASRYSADDAEIHVAAAREGANAVVRVRDSGTGMPAAFVSRVFEPFARGDGDEGRAPSVAMSLPVARKLVEMHGGRIEAKSDGEGRGSEFVVTLPAIESGQRGAAPAGAQPQPRAAGASARRVLLVDDNRAVRETYADVLADMGCDVKTAADGEQAIAYALQWRPRFVILDINLPKRNGYDVARTLRSQFRPDEMTLVMISGVVLDTSTRASAQAAGFDHCLDKASDLPRLERLLAAT